MRLALSMVNHPDVQVRQIWEGMRWRFDEDLRSGRRILGDCRTVTEQRVEDNGAHIDKEARRGGGAPIVKSWLGSFDCLMREAEQAWDDGWTPRKHRDNDTHLLQLISKLEEEETLDGQVADRVREGVVACDIRWLSQLADATGERIYRWDRVKGWEWVSTLMEALKLATSPRGEEWLIPTHRRMGGWVNEEHNNATAQTVWGEGITQGTLVSRRGEERMGVVMAMGTVEEGGRVWVEWRDVRAGVNRQ